jgi:hypothetical protein
MTDDRFDDGFSTLLTFSENEDIKIWEIEVTPPGFDGGGMIDTTTMRNTAKRTRRPKALTTMTNGGATVAYAGSALEAIQDMINVLQEITVTFPESAGTMTFWGWINNLIPGPNSEGNRPTATMEIIPSNEDDTGVEAEATFT